MKKYLLTLAVIAVFVFYLMLNNKNLAVVSQNPDVTPVTAGTSTPAGTPGSKGTYKDGTYTGNPSDALYGTIQVAAVISGGKLTDVQVLQYPQGGGHTDQTSAMSLPILRQEAITAQSANVNVVSGATQTSQGFQQSLASALAQA